MFKKNMIFFLFFLFFSYGYSQVNFTINYTEDHSQHMITGGAPITIYQPHINITRTSNDEAVDIDIFSIKLYSMNSSNWVKFFMEPNVYLNNNGISLFLKKLYLNGRSISIIKDVNHITIENQWTSNPKKSLTGDYNISIARNTPDFQAISLGNLTQQNSYPVNMGSVSLTTLHPLTVNVPDIDFGDVIVTSGNLTKTGQIVVTGSVNTKVSFDIPVHNFKLYKRGSTSNGISASANIDGRILKHENTIGSNRRLTKNLNVTISNFSSLPSGRYEGDLLINIDSN